MKTSFLAGVLFVLSGLFPLLATGQNERLVVGTKVAPPFVIKNEDGGFSGISIDLWTRTAEQLGFDYEFRETDLRGLIEGLENGSLDVSVAALTVTSSREQVIDFSHPFYTTGLAIAVPYEGSSIWQVVRRLFSWEFLLVLAALGCLLLMVGVLLWAAERHKNKSMFGGTPLRGIGASFWWAAVTMTTVGYGDKAPITLAGRVVGLVWMFAAIILISSFTAAIATSLTVSQLETSIENLEDLRHARTATVAGSSSAEFLSERSIGFSEAERLDLALQGLAKKQFDAVVYDKPILLYLSSQEYPRRTRVIPEIFDRQDYAIALPQSSRLREDINQALLDTIETPQWQMTLEKYLGEAE